MALHGVSWIYNIPRKTINQLHAYQQSGCYRLTDAHPFIKNPRRVDVCVKSTRFSRSMYENSFSHYKKLHSECIWGCLPPVWVHSRIRPAIAYCVFSPFACTHGTVFVLSIGSSRGVLYWNSRASHMNGTSFSRFSLNERTVCLMIRVEQLSKI